jgi:MFS family permease
MSGAALERGALLRDADFRRYVTARFFSGIAAQMLVIGVGWQVYRMTGRLLDLGLIGLSQFLPFLAFALFAGHAADRFDRRLILCACAVVQAGCALALGAAAVAGIASTGPIFAILALLGVARAFQMPAAQSFLPNLVPAEALPAAVAIGSSTAQVATIAGPSLGGVVYALAQTRLGATAGAGAVYLGAAVLLALALAMLVRVRRRVGSARRGAAARDLLQGLRFVWRRKPVLGALSLDLFAVLFGGATALLPAFTRDVLHAGPAQFGLLRAAPGLGAGLTALWLAAAPIRRRVGPTMFAGVAVFGVATVVFGLTRRFAIALIALVVLGASDMISVFVRHVLVQLATPDEIRGRVSAVNSMFIGASNELGEFESGLTAAWLGLVPAIVAGGVATLVVGALWSAWLFPQLRRLDSFDEIRGWR